MSVDQPVRGSRYRRIVRRVVIAMAAVVWCFALVLGGALVALTIEYSGTPSPDARSTGNDAEWLGHAWVDGRKEQSDVDALATQLRVTGIRDLFVHTGPFNDDGTLDPALRPRARWLIQAMHSALPGVRVQAWLGAHPIPEELHLDSKTTRASLLASVGQVLDDGFDGIHYDFEPVADGDEDLLAILRETRVVTRQRNALLSVSAIHHEPWPGMAAGVTMLPGRLALWSGDSPSRPPCPTISLGSCGWRGRRDAGAHASRCRLFRSRGEATARAFCSAGEGCESAGLTKKARREPGLCVSLRTKLNWCP